MEISQGIEPWVVTYGNVSQGKRQMEGSDDAVPSIIESQGDEKVFRRNWAWITMRAEAGPAGDGMYCWSFLLSVI
jgi:hypothetical protein